MPDISLLPEDLRREEQQLPKGATSRRDAGSLKMHIPDAAVDEDIEIIEVDESELGSVLADEPFLTRASYRVSVAWEKLRQRLSGGSEKVSAPPAKTPPAFFTPPKGLATKGLSTDAQKGAAPVRARITPGADVPRRVRVIRHVRKPVRVSLITPEELLAYQVDVPKRKWTLAVCAALFAVMVGGGYGLLTVRVGEARAALSTIEQQTAATRTEIQSRERQWLAYRDLQHRLTVLGALLDQHVVITRLFDFLERRTLPEVAYRTATLSSDAVLALDVTANSYDAASRQLVAFQQSPLVRSADAASFNGQIDGETGAIQQVSFQLTLTLNAGALQGAVALQDSPSVSSTVSGTPSP
ncbi:MAG: hypothetical protein RL141_320 [Candidatus Parcubacteria bacterium]|jgi:hypothetical protein